ncbi:MAG TPA: hypothetical protein VND64_19655 [Pirellulales bacterium]|nr:hypothetical protein [Pirellulales bacterium]
MIDHNNAGVLFRSRDPLPPMIFLGESPKGTEVAHLFALREDEQLICVFHRALRGALVNTAALTSRHLWCRPLEDETAALVLAQISEFRPGIETAQLILKRSLEGRLDNFPSSLHGVRPRCVGPMDRQYDFCRGFTPPQFPGSWNGARRAAGCR